MSKLLSRIFGKPGQEKYIVDAPVEISIEEATRLQKQHDEELKKIAPFQKRLEEETALLKQVVEFELSPGDRKKVREMLASGEDPALIAAYLKAPFKVIAVIANDVLQEAYGNSPDAPRIPTDLQEYIKLAQDNAAKTSR